MRLRIAARKSDLARLQALLVGDALKKVHPHLRIDYVFKESLGDKNLTDPLWKMPEKGVFTEDFYDDLIHDKTDMVVHSWKDLPTEPKSNTVIASTLPRADQRDLFILKLSHFEQIRRSRRLRVYSSSPRRQYNLTDFLKTHLPFTLLNTVDFETVRGNIPTRLRKLVENPAVDGLIVAKAAVDRLLSTHYEEFKEMQQWLRSCLQSMKWTILPLSVNPNAAAQGALAIEILSSRQDLFDILKPIHDEQTFYCVQKERDILASFGGGCHQKIGVAVLPRSYGEIRILKGVTDQGQILNMRNLKSNSHPLFPEEEMWSKSQNVERISQIPPLLPPDINALYVARREAWPEGFSFSGIVWTAGLKTWEKLAKEGIWVHGCSESLGEHEGTTMESLAGAPLQWMKLSHEEGYADGGIPLLATYRLKPTEKLGPFEGKKSFFWNSGSQFFQAVKEDPRILEGYHASGPGSTYKMIRDYLEKKKIFNHTNVRIFLDQNDWRQKCKK